MTSRQRQRVAEIHDLLDQLRRDLFDDEDAAELVEVAERRLECPALASEGGRVWRCRVCPVTCRGNWAARSHERREPGHFCDQNEV
jgi:hypothetical protein